ncbi:hypothetical protein [Butyricimonas synergistica]|uniref:hypothetical protein n=1 Tax=Butyricimonas synergistica TaxID=544644 RepID=UPI00039DB385|nr:hypothetical protein [Butyricimonas synergistica]
MRKISLLVVLITMVMFSCVDDKESAVVEQIRTAKTAWLQAQAEMLKAQGEAAKIAAETEKLKAENDAKNEAARIEIEKLKAQAEAAKTEAEAEMIRAQIEKINQELEQARLEFEYQQKLNELAYQVAEAKAAYKLQEFQNKLNEAIIAGKMNPELIKLYTEYTNALKTLRDAELQVSNNQRQIASYEKMINGNFEDYVKGLQKQIADAQEAIEKAKTELDIWMNTNTSVTEDEALAKIEELEGKKNALDEKYNELTLKMIELQAEQSKLLAAKNTASIQLSEAEGAKNIKEKELDEATKAYEEAQKGINSAKADIIREFPEYEFGVLDGINKKITELEEESASTADDFTKAEEALAKAKTDIPNLYKKMEETAEAVEPFVKEKERLAKALTKAEEDVVTYEGKRSTLKDKMDTEKGVYDNHTAEVKRLTDLLKDKDLTAEQIAQYQRELRIAEELATTAKTTYDAAKKAFDDNETALKDAKTTVAGLNKDITTNDKALADAEKAKVDAETKYKTTMSDVAEGGKLANAVIIAENNANLAKEAEENFKARFEAAQKSLDEFLADKTNAEKAVADAEKVVADAEEAHEAALKAIEDSEYTKTKEDRENIGAEKAVYDELIANYQGIFEEGFDPEAYKKTIEDAKKKCNDAIEAQNKKIKECQTLIEEFEAADEIEKDEIVTGHEYVRNQIAELEQEILDLQERIVIYQAEVDRLQGVIDSLEDAE